MEKEKAKCRGCGKELKGDAYRYGGRAYDLVTGKEAKKNYYGGFVCSYTCDHRSSLELEQSMPGQGMSQKNLGQESARSLKNNWNN